MNIRIALGTFVLFGLIPAYAQQPKSAVIVEGGTSYDRGSARVLYMNTVKHEAAGQFTIEYGRPLWKSSYEDPAQFDRLTKGKTWRMGSNFWTVLDTDLPLKISGKDVPAGYYYLGLHRSEDGSKWSLAFIDPAQARAAHLDASQIGRAPISFEIPMSVASNSTKPERLTIDLSYSKDDLHKANLAVTWGTLALSAPIDVMPAE
jgi:hypothetical protein